MYSKLKKMCSLLALLFLVTVVQTTDTYNGFQCYHACSNLQTPGLANVCQKCAENHPVNYVLCEYSCANKQADKSLRTICDRCFAERPTLMSKVCIYACRRRQKTLDYERLCNECIPLEMSNM